MKRQERIKYSDGNIEEHIEDLIKKANVLSSFSDIAKEEYKDWAVRYHLSSIRSNAIKHLDFSGLDVLELGAGMGAMSRYLAENCKNLTVVEGTEQRMNCLKLRLRDLSNWDSFIGNYQDFHTDKKYDVVCFFGVLEYAGKYIEKEKPFEWAINHAKSFLKEGGILLVLIENKNGLKYFAGLTEDHYGKAFYGICGYPETKVTKTFSKKEIIDMFGSCDFKKTYVHHLAPDYKCTRAVLTDEFIHEKPLESADIFSNYKAEDYGRVSEELFPSSLVYVSLAKSGLFDEFSNSYLFISSLKENSSIEKSLLKNIREKNEKAFLYTYGRKKEVVTKIIKKDEKYIVHKEFLLQNTKSNDKNIIENKFKDEPLFDGLSMSYFITNSLYYNNPDKFMTIMEDYFSYIFKNYTVKNENLLNPCVFDAMVRNVKINGKEINIFDNEYNINFELTKSFFIFRCILSLQSICNFLDKINFNSFYEIYLYFCKNFNIKDEIDSNIELEAKIQNEIAGIDYKTFKKEIKKGFFKNKQKKLLKKYILKINKIFK